jgi:D-lactate dehydrogenase
MPFSSKGFARQGDWKLKELENAVLEASSAGRYPVLIDTSPCLYRMKESLAENQELQLLEPAEFILKFLAPRLRFKKSSATVVVHPPCSSLKLGLDSRLRELAQLCAEGVVVPDNIGCCGFAGDRGFSYPELTASALDGIRGSLPQDCRAGYSTSKTCEIGLSLHSGIPYQSIAYLVDECTETR